MKYLSLFSGIGGFEYGIGEYGECVGFSEINEYAIEIYRRHYPEHRPFGDISKVRTADLPDFDLLVGGFPCQAFSMAGKRCGFDDPRGNLFFEIARILRDKKPKHFLLENVRGLLSHDKGRTLQHILEVLTDLGYNVEWQVLNSQDFGVPQARERIYIVGHLIEPGRSIRQVFPISEGIRQVRIVKVIKDSFQRSIHDIDGCAPTVLTDGTIRIFDGERYRKLTPVEVERLQGFPDGWTEGVSDTRRYFALGNAVTTNVIKAIIERLYGLNGNP